MRTTKSVSPLASSVRRLSAVWADINNGQRALIEFNRPAKKR